ncbi:toxin-antitoxin system, toxin component [Streptomyces scabichelini]|uniref:toxin-antitoxin system, toxin component n=1 Tax=Streptomyces scabichelini TaxID=2711217 RepID=UPI001F49A3E1|nr:toxin-antitoxin system, toxin component [Streptomyces scabichelini]
MRRLVTRLVGEFQAEKEMRQFIDRLVGELRAGGRELSIPTDPDELFAALIEVVSEIRGRNVVLLKEEFPHRTATGLWLDLPEEDLILVDKRATPLHQLAILFHEIWHMIKGDCGHHVAGAAVAARMLDKRADLRHLQSTVVRVAARSVFDEQVEQDAETFALKAVTHFRVWLEGKPDNTDRTQIAGRIGASLGSRRPQA